MILFISLDQPSAEPSFKFKSMSLFLISTIRLESWFQSEKDLILMFFETSNHSLLFNFIQLNSLFRSLKVVLRLF